MQRKNYNITVNGQLKAIKHSWNTASRYTAELTKPIAIAEKCFYYRGKTEHNKDFSQGSVIWSNGTNTIKYDIELMNKDYYNY